MTSSTLLPVAGVKKEETSPCKIISKYQGRRITPTLKRVTLTPRSITIQDDYLRDFQEAMTHQWQWRRRRQVRTREYQYQKAFLKVVWNSKNHCLNNSPSVKATGKSTLPMSTSRHATKQVPISSKKSRSNQTSLGSARPDAGPHKSELKLIIVHVLVEPEIQTLLLTAGFLHCGRFVINKNGLTLEPCLELSGQLANAAKCAIDRAHQSTGTTLPSS